MTSSDLIALGATLVAVVGLVQGWRAGRKADKATREANDLTKQHNDLVKQNLAVQERLAQIEQSREHDRLMQALQAVLTAELRQTDRGGHRLFIANAGQGTARNLAITLDGKPLAEHPATSGNKDGSRIIGPGAEASYYMSLNRSCHPPFELDAMWDDDSGQQGRFSTTLTF